MYNTISYHIYNTISSENLLSLVMPFEYRKAVNGFYSKLWKDLRISVASSNKIDKTFIRLNLLRDRKLNEHRPKRMLVVFPSGARIDLPFDLNATDFKIINLHIEALKLSRQSQS